jgi:hypothetical protein
MWFNQMAARRQNIFAKTHSRKKNCSYDLDKYHDLELLIVRMQNRKSNCSYDLNHKFESLQCCRNTLGAKEKPKLTGRKCEINTMWASMNYDFETKFGRNPNEKQHKG